MMGYWRDPAATLAKHEDGWLRTGDLAVRGDDGMLRLIGRIDDLINRGGEKISPIEVEAAVSAHPDVLEAAVVGLPDADLGQVAGAAVVSRPGSGLDAAALGDFLAGRIADFKRPARVAFIDSLPRNPNGKVLKDAVRRIIEGASG
jgi:acyl-CoA synthetase (AMP-forming)/AMP-acid ligase II